MNRRKEKSWKQNCRKCTQNRRTLSGMQESGLEYKRNHELLDGCTEYAGCYFKWQYCTILQAFEKERANGRRGWRRPWLEGRICPCRSRKLPCYTIGRENVSKNSVFQMYSPHSFSQGYGNAGIWFRPLQTGKPSSLQGQNRSIGEALLMEMKQKEQEINKRKRDYYGRKTNERDSLKCNEPSRKRDFWEELQKVHLKNPQP